MKCGDELYVIQMMNVTRDKVEISVTRPEGQGRATDCATHPHQEMSSITVRACPRLLWCRVMALLWLANGAFLKV